MVSLDQKDNDRKQNLIYLALFVFVMVLYHVAMKLNFGDEGRFFSKQLDNRSLFEYLSMRYNTWTSRMIIEALEVLLTRNMLTRNIVLWKVLDIGVWTLLAYSLYKLSHKTSLFVVLSLLLLYPLMDMASAGWLVGTLNYLWPMAFEMYSLIALDKISCGERVPCWQIALSLLAAVIGVNFEQSCAVHLGLLLVYTFYAVSRSNTRQFWLFLVHYVITFGMLLFIFTCPGNPNRSAFSVPMRGGIGMPDFYEKTKIDMLIDGFETTLSRTTCCYNIIFFVFACFLFCCVWKKTTDIRYRITGGIPLLVSFSSLILFVKPVLSLCVTIITTWGNKPLGVQAALLRETDVTGVTAANWMALSSYLPFVIFVVTVVCVIMSFFILFDDFVKACECAFIYLLAIATGTVLGFSPTLYESAVRTLWFFYVLLIFLMLKITEYCPVQFSTKELVIGKRVLSIFCAAMIFFNLGTTVLIYFWRR